VLQIFVRTVFIQRPSWPWSYGSWIYNCSYAISAYHHWCCEFESRSGRGVQCTTLCHKVSQWLATGRWFSTGTPISFTNKTDPHDITEILLKVELKTIQPTNQSICWKISSARHVCSCTFFRIYKWNVALKPSTFTNLNNVSNTLLFSVLTHKLIHSRWFLFLLLIYIKLLSYNIGCHLTNTWGPKNRFSSLWH